MGEEGKVPYHFKLMCFNNTRYCFLYLGNGLIWCALICLVYLPMGNIDFSFSFRSMFIDKFLLWKVFPLCCLRWILQFAVLECPPGANSLTKGHNTRGLIDTVQHLVAVWSKQEFVQSAPIEQQTCILPLSFPP